MFIVLSLVWNNILYFDFQGRLLIKWAAIEVVFKKIRTIQSDV